MALPRFQRPCHFFVRPIASVRAVETASWTSRSRAGPGPGQITRKHQDECATPWLVVHSASLTLGFESSRRASIAGFNANVLVTRKGAVRARDGDLGIIPGSMGARSFIVQGKGNRDSFQSCSHGAGRKMSRGEAKRTFSIEDHVRATDGVECRKDAEVIDETPGAYKDIDAVMAAQQDLVDVIHTLKQIVCVKG